MSIVWRYCRLLPSLPTPHITPLHAPLSCQPSIPPYSSHPSPPCTTVLSTLHPSLLLTSLPSMHHRLVNPPSLPTPHIPPLHALPSCQPSIPPYSSHPSPPCTTILSTLHSSLLLTSCQPSIPFPPLHLRVQRWPFRR